MPKLTINQCSVLLGAHKALDGIERVVKEGEGERVVRQSYKIPFSMRLALAENIEILEGHIRRFEAQRLKLFNSHADGKTELSGDALTAFGKVMEEAVNHEEEMDLRLIDFADLGKADDPFPPSVLSALLMVRKP